MADYRAQRLARIRADYERFTAQCNPMTENNITPPPELLQLWFEQHYSYNKGLNELFIEVARYGADQELEECCEAIRDRKWFGDPSYRIAELRAARRPEPPSLKEQALDAHNRMMAGEETQDDWAIVRRALEQLDD
jgi:hypothetical protein